MATLTLFFGGTSHGIHHEDDTMVETFNHVTSPKAFFPGPGSPDPKIYVSPDYLNLPHQSLTEKNGAGNPGGIPIGHNYRINDKRSSQTNRQVGGKGWNRNVWYATMFIYDHIVAENVKINIVGHSRGSITVLMLLNDLFHEHFSPSSYTTASTRKSGKKTFRKKLTKKTFSQWYKSRLTAIYKARMGGTEGGDEAQRALDALDYINAHDTNISEINAWLYDPVAGTSQGCTSRKQTFPEHRKIKRVRVLRMEQGGDKGALSTNMPRFGTLSGWSFLTGAQNYNLDTYLNRERLVIPLPGTHGAGLGLNVDPKKDPLQGRTAPQRYIGTSYMVGLLNECGTQFENGYVEQWGDATTMVNLYDLLYRRFLNVLPEGHQLLSGFNTRKKIHTHHTSAGYAGNSINAHHTYLSILKHGIDPRTRVA